MNYKINKSNNLVIIHLASILYQEKKCLERPKEDLVFYFLKQLIFYEVIFTAFLDTTVKNLPL